MAALPFALKVLWALSGAVQLLVFVLVIAKHYSGKLPMFTAYVTLNLVQAALLVVVYSRIAFHSTTSYELYWISEVLTLVAQTLAATELLRYALRQYRGIWALIGRVLALASFVVVASAAVNAGKDTDWGLMIADRGYHLTFAVAIVLCLVAVRVYSIPVNPTYKTILAGFCIFSCSFVVANTVLKILFLQRFAAYNDVWNYGNLLVFVAVYVAWAVALLQPASATDEEAELLPASTYQELSPEINSRLRVINDTLCRFWRLEPPRQ
jgi:hypothetical protein